MHRIPDIGAIFSRLTGQSAKVRPVMRTRMVGALSAAVLVVVAGCGSSASYDNTPRPPAPVDIGVNITNGRINLSPGRLGAGPVVLLVANSSDTSQDLTLTSAASGSSCVADDASSGPINPQDTARVSVNLVRGTCSVGVKDGGVSPARLVVGAQRTSAQADLLQP
jgi:hypothetical protein